VLGKEAFSWAVEEEVVVEEGVSDGYEGIIW
jgi:hypothetical protein